MNANTDAEQSIDVCANVNSNIKLLIFIIIMVILAISFFILVLNTLSYILFTIYCINDNANLYMAEDPDSVILGDTYKYKLLNYVKNIDYKPPKEGETYKSFVKYDYDSGSSDLYIHKAIAYYNYIVKLLLLIIFLIVIGVLYNVYIKLVSWSSGCNVPPAVCEFILIGIFNDDRYIYYIILILFAYIFIHSYIYTNFFNKSIYDDLYDIYAGDTREVNYKNADTIVYESINRINNATAAAPGTETPYLKTIKDLSFYELIFTRFMAQDNTVLPDSGEKYKNLLNYGIQYNNRFVIPPTFYNENENDFIDSLSHICAKEGLLKNNVKADAKEQEVLANKIFLYLIYHYVITNNIEDPFIIHKLNNIYLDIFTNIYQHLMSKEIKEGRKDTEYTDDFLERFNIDIKKMYKDIRCSYSIKLLLPIGTKKENVLKDLHSNAGDLLKLLSKRFDIIEQEPTPSSLEDTLHRSLIDYKYDEAFDKNDALYDLKHTISEKIKEFAEKGFADYYQEDKTANDINRIVYKINFYLAIDMLQPVLCILIVLLILYKSTKFPYLELYINMAITYVVLIINEVVSAILGIV